MKEHESIHNEEISHVCMTCGKKLLAVDKEHDIPMGVSQWKEHGKKYGYWDFWEKYSPEKQEN